jgi:phytoene dehydrogenase-like protein
LDFNQGVFYPKGGIYSLVEALTAIGKKLDVKYHYASPVQRIRTVQGQATGVVLENGQSIDADIVISNADLEYTETALLERGEQTYPAAFWQKKQAAPSAILLYLGISGSLPSLKHHNILFTRDWRANFESIFERQQWTHPASMYICKPSATDKSVAPHGNENVYKKIYGPEEFKRDLHAWHGTALGLSHTLRQSAFFRPKNYSRRVKQLYYVGANTVPGIGLPMCLISAEVLYKRLIDDRTAGPLQSPIVASTAEV